jgi:hypothetical protein
MLPFKYMCIKSYLDGNRLFYMHLIVFQEQHKVPIPGRACFKSFSGVLVFLFFF